ncbi:Uncharacterised protein [Candidatus Tiddalikarchaeum anstoanum]|nr:Uncharacterised protein [Candidatus Tiddalikarchaeum anstoanum]
MLRIDCKQQIRDNIENIIEPIILNPNIKEIYIQQNRNLEMLAKYQTFIYGGQLFGKIELKSNTPIYTNHDIVHQITIINYPNNPVITAASHISTAKVWLKEDINALEHTSFQEPPNKLWINPTLSFNDKIIIGEDPKYIITLKENKIQPL